MLASFLDYMNKMEKTCQVRQDANLVDHIGKIEKPMTGVVTVLQRLFQDFGTPTQDLWGNLSAERFEKAKKLIPDYTPQFGVVLCGLTVKMNAWIDRYQNPRSASPISKGEFLMTDIRQGVANIRAIATGQN